MKLTSRIAGGRLFLKFAGFTLGLFVVFLFALIAVLVLQQQKAFEDGLKDRWRTHADLGANSISEAIASLNFDYVPTVMELIGKHADVVRSAVIKADGQWSETSEQREAGPEDLEDPVVRLCMETGEPAVEVRPALGGESGLAVVAVPINTSLKPWGVLRIDYSTSRLDKLGQQLNDRLALLTIVFLIAGATGALFLARHISRPVGVLTQLAERVSAGDLDAHCELRRGDELGDLARSFNQMVGSLKVAREGARIYLDNILESMLDSLVVVETSGDKENGGSRVRTVNQATLDLLGCVEGDLIGRPFDPVVGGTPAWRALLDRIRSNRGLRNFDMLYRARDGTERPVRFSASIMTPCRHEGADEECPVHGGTGAECARQATSFVLVASDIHELKVAERTRQATREISECVKSAEGQEELFAEVHRILDGLMATENFRVALLDVQSNALTFPYIATSVEDSPAIGAASRFLAEHVLRTLEALHADEDRIRHLLGTEAGSGSDAGLREWVGAPLVVDGRAIGVMAIQTSERGRRFSQESVELLAFVSKQLALALERRRAEEERARLSSAVEQAADAIFITNNEGRIQYVNPAFTRTTGYSREEALGQPLDLLRSEVHDEDFYRELWVKVSGGSTWTGRIVNRRKDGAEYEVDAAISPVKDPTGRSVNFVSVQHDVTQVVALEEQLRQAQKMEAIGKLAGGVAHDFNNLLSIINGCCELLIRGMGEDDPLLGRVREINRAGQRAASLTRQLLAFSRRQVLMPRVLSLSAVVGDVEKMLRRLIGEHIELVTDLDPEIERAMADPGQIEQVILNLAVNARDAMPEGGTLTIRTCNVALDLHQLRNDPELLPGRYVMLSVGDTGAGIDPGHRGRLFEPFFTTKAQGKGTGLGLSTVYGIVKQSKGHITVESIVGAGATFQVFLPRVTEPEATAQGEEAVGSQPIGAGTVLLVEDEDGVREVARAFLQELGYSVISASNGIEAIEIADSRQGDFDLLLTDVVMPRLGGRELAERLTKSYPGLRVVFMSGYTDQAVFLEGELGPEMAFLAKPFTMDDMGRIVGRALDPERRIRRQGSE